MDKGNVASRFFKNRYLFSIGFFILSLLSKPMTVSLPVVLLILDWYPFQRIRSPKTLWTALVEKSPFIALSIFSSVMTILAQQAVGAVASIRRHTVVNAHSRGGQISRRLSWEDGWCL